MRQDRQDIRTEYGARQDIRQDKGDRPMQEDKSTQTVKEIVKGFIGRNVTVVVRGKKTLSGKLESVSNYELLLTVKHEPVIIMKHAIDYIELAATPS
jgi:ribosome maturation factor RimP